MVVACAVLHNLCIRSGDIEPPEDQTIEGNRRPYEEVPGPRCQIAGTAGAMAMRTNIINNHFRYI